MAIVTEVYPGADGRVRSACVSYKRFKTGESAREYGGAAFTSIKRSVQRLVLLVPVDDVKTPKVIAETPGTEE